MKRLPILILIGCLFVVSAAVPADMRAENGQGAAEEAAASTLTDIGVSVDGEPLAFEAPPRLMNGHLMVPLGNIAGALDAEVAREGTALTATATNSGDVVRLTIGETTADRNGHAFTLDEPPVMIGGVLFVPARGFAESLGAIVSWNDNSRTVVITSAEASLPVVGSMENLQKLLAESRQKSMELYGKASSVIVTDQAAAVEKRPAAPNPPTASESAAQPKSSAPATGGSGGSSASAGVASGGRLMSSADVAPPDYSATNTQVQGVDEADIVKTDGKYIYQVNGNRVIVAQAYPADRMEIVASLEFDRPFQPLELYVDDKHLVVIGSALSAYPQATPKAEPSVEAGPAGSVKILPRPYPGGSLTAKAIIYDIADKAHIAQQREVELEGAYVSSRKIGSALYLVTNKAIRYRYGTDGKIDGADPGDVPFYRDSAAGDEPVKIDYERIRYFPEAVLSNYLLIGGLDLEDANRQMNVSAYLGSGQNVYASEKNMYVAVTHSEYAFEPLPQPQSDSQSGNGAQPQAQSQSDSGTQPPAPPQPAQSPAAGQSSPATQASAAATRASAEKLPVTASSVKPAPGNAAQPLAPIAIFKPRINESTLVYRFTLDRGKVSFAAKGTVPGKILNQFSMDEYDGYFRIATTKGNDWGMGDDALKNNVYVLDETLQTTGKIEDLAPGERIYSVRFTGARGYIVTFRTVDPLFVIDLNPHAPQVLGALKIPGYSDYLQPYDDNHLIGFGKNTVELPNKGMSADGPQTTAYYLGMKMALFDVSDVAHPVELFTENIGDRGTESELLSNHKALLFSKEKNVLAFPVSVRETSNGAGKTNDPLQYGQLTFQGAYVYGIDLDKGFQFKGKITHLSDQDLLKSGYGTSDRNIDRILYIDHNLYTVSRAMIMANDLDTLKELNRLTLAQ